MIQTTLATQAPSFEQTSPLKNRRSCKRFNVQLPVIITRQGSTTSITAETRDISSDGFFCLAEEPFNIGEMLQCLIILPGPSSSEDKQTCIRATVEVVRVVADQSLSTFGIGCRTLEFEVVNRP